jgi:peptidoglycan/LPS O-acetylase OafA/YrhL
MASIAILIIFLRSGMTLHVPFFQYLSQIAQNMALGIFPFVEMNGDAASAIVVAGVTWTLQYEWLFYAALPVLAIFARSSRTHLPFTASLLALVSIIAFRRQSLDFTLYAFFACGMLCASLENKALMLRPQPLVLSVGVVAILLATTLIYDTAYRTEVVLLLGLSFYLLLNGASMFGLLLARL